MVAGLTWTIPAEDRLLQELLVDPGTILQSWKSLAGVDPILQNCKYREEADMIHRNWKYHVGEDKPRLS